MGKKKRARRLANSAPIGVPADQRCDDVSTFTGSVKLQCPIRAEFMLDHDEFDRDNLPKFCSRHVGKALRDLIEPGCGIDELTILRAPAVRITT